MNWRTRGEAQDHWIDLEWGFEDNLFPEYRAAVKWDGCVHLEAFSNGADPDDPGDDRDYLHICDMEGHIKMLQDLVKQARQHFGKGWPE